MSSHELNSSMILVHPPLSIVGYILTFLFAISLFSMKRAKRKIVRVFGLLAWLFTLLGLITGMIWAQIAWGSYWSWDPKETLTLVFFLSLSASQLAFSEDRLRLSRWISFLSCTLSIATLSASFIMEGLHSFM